MKLKLTSEVPKLNRTCALDTGEDLEPQRTASASEISSDVAIKDFILDVANQKWEGGVSTEADVVFDDNFIDLIPRKVVTTEVRGSKCRHKS